MFGEKPVSQMSGGVESESRRSAHEQACELGRSYGSE